MKLIARLLVIFGVVPATYWFIYWVPFSLWSAGLGEQRWVIGSIVSLFCAVVVGWFVWLKLGSTHQGFFSSMLLGAILIGGIGFSAGFFGPMIFAPKGSYLPLLGVAITGPLGFVLGGIAGFLHWRSNQSDTHTS